MSKKQAKRARQQARRAQPPPRRPAWWRSRRAGVIAAAAAAAALVAVGVVVARGGSGSAVAMPVYSASNGRIEFSGDDPVTGREVDLAAYQGKAVVVNIWASWCTGCNAEAPDLRRLAQLHPEAQLVGVDYQDTRGEAKSFYRRWGLSHPSVFDGQRLINLLRGFSLLG